MDRLACLGQSWRDERELEVPQLKSEREAGLLEAIGRLFLRPGVSDLACVCLLGVGASAGVTLEPSHREAWLVLPSLVAAPLLSAGVLLLMPYRSTTAFACLIHLALLLAYLLGLLLAAFLLVTILVFGAGIILGPACALLALNSAFTLGRSVYLARQRDLDERSAAARAHS